MKERSAKITGRTQRSGSRFHRGSSGWCRWLLRTPATPKSWTLVEQVLWPGLPPGKMMVVRQRPVPSVAETTAALVTTAGWHLLFLPAYPPDSNPSKHLWAAVKKPAAAKAAPPPPSQAFLSALPTLVIVNCYSDGVSAGNTLRSVSAGAAGH